MPQHPVCTMAAVLTSHRTMTQMCILKILMNINASVMLCTVERIAKVGIGFTRYFAKCDYAALSSTKGPLAQ